MTTVSEMVNEILGILDMGEETGEIDLLAGQMGLTDVSFTATAGSAGFRSGNVVQIGSELMRITAYNATTKLVSVLRGFSSTPIAAHNAGDVVEINPRHPRHLITKRMKEEIESWDHNLYAVMQYEFTVNPNGNIRNFPITIPAGSEIVRDIGLYRRDKETERWIHENRWTKIYPDPDGGWSINIHKTVPGFTRYVYTFGYTFNLSVFDDGTDLNSVVGLRTGMEEIVRYGAMARLYMGIENRRVRRQNQGQSGDPREVREGSSLQLAGQWRGMADRAKLREASYLHSLYPISFR